MPDNKLAYASLLSDYDVYLLGEGRHRHMWECMGARLMEINKTTGVRFVVWAPNAKSVSVVGNFNGWNGTDHKMHPRGAGLWEVFVQGLGEGEIYKYEIIGKDGLLPLKADPFALQTEIPPATGSIISRHIQDNNRFKQQRERAPQDLNKPLSIYEVHVTSWMKHYNNQSYSWGELAKRLIPYVKNLGFTHIQLMPIMGHPYSGSWGYQPLSHFAPMPELGTPEDFAEFVACCHELGLGVILDWVPAHFPVDVHGLARFDGTALYEHIDPREGFHPDWNTYIFNLGRDEVRGFLISSALFWLEYFGVDGLRVDAVASMLYRDYSRKEGEWIANFCGGRENFEAVSFLKELSSVINEHCPGALLIAEESTTWPGVTAAVKDGGLGFSHKWNMGWMHDSLSYMNENPIHRSYHHDLMTFGLTYAFKERFILPISHDEVVHGKRSLLGRMPGDEWQKFANLRAYLAFMWTHPGKKHLFMGCEFGQLTEWNYQSELSWHLLQKMTHQGVQATIRNLNYIYKTEAALYQRDFDVSGFSWIVSDDRDQSVFAYLRCGKEDSASILTICNLTPILRCAYQLGVPEGKWTEIFNSDNAEYGGSGVANNGIVASIPCSSHGHQNSISLTLPPLATIILRQGQ